MVALGMEVLGAATLELEGMFMEVLVVEGHSEVKECTAIMLVGTEAIQDKVSMHPVFTLMEAINLAI